MLNRDFLNQFGAIIVAIPHLPTRDYVARKVATLLAPHNPRFDRALFLKRCGVTPKRAITITISLEPMGRSQERLHAADALTEVVKIIRNRGIDGAFGFVIYDKDLNEIGHVTTETKDA